MTEVAERPEPVGVVASARFPAGAPAGWRIDPADPAQERYWDGRHWAEQARPFGTPDADTRAAVRAAAQRAKRYRRRGRTRPWLHTLGILARTGLLLTVLATGLNALWQVHQYNVVSVELMRTTDSGEILGALSDVTATSLRLTVVVALIQILSWLFFVAWVVGVYTDRRTNREALRHAVPVAVLAGILPVVQLWWPMQVVADAWNATDPRQHHRRPPAPPSILAWWVLTLLSVAVPLGMTTYAYMAGTENGLLSATTMGTILSALLFGMAQICLYVAIGHISWHLEAHDIRDRAAYVKG
ncbi:MAG: DUF4328 domain-containing protein [Lapillicoccus sp.]